MICIQQMLWFPRWQMKQMNMKSFPQPNCLKRGMCTLERARIPKFEKTKTCCPIRHDEHNTPHRRIGSAALRCGGFALLHLQRLQSYAYKELV